MMTSARLKGGRCIPIEIRPMGIASGEQSRYRVELARSGRSKCKGCKNLIQKGHPRIGLDVPGVKFTTTLWFHTQCAKVKTQNLLKAKGLETLDERTVKDIGSDVIMVKALPYKGGFSMGQLSNILSDKFDKFRNFRFGLPDDELYSSNWNWRAFISTMLVCNTREDGMLRFVEEFLFQVYPDPGQLAIAEKEDVEEIKKQMKKYKINPKGISSKAWNIIFATQNILENYRGEIPDSRTHLMKMRGVGRHVSSVTLAWVHKKSEFGVDRHVSRILERWGYVESGARDTIVEKLVKAEVEDEQIGHFSRSLVDLGQSVCGFTPNCGDCFLRSNCPTGRNLTDIEDLY